MNQECWLKVPLVQKVQLVILGRLVQLVPLVLLETPVKGDPQEEEDFQVLMVHPDLQAQCSCYLSDSQAEETLPPKDPNFLHRNPRLKPFCSKPDWPYEVPLVQWDLLEDPAQWDHRAHQD